MVELILNMFECSILSHDVSKFFCFIPQLRFLISVKSYTVKGFYLINECLKDKVCGVFSLFVCKGGNWQGEERALYSRSSPTLELNWLFLKRSFGRGLKFGGPFLPL